ncbi:MAG TPA: TPM domain-containing protein [Verrucomicrobiae bacterium]|nr:TPM domain-containing protein [Verrucomicrobiae bacterium]
MKEFLNQLRPDEIVAAIQKAEKNTSAEIRVFISRKNIDDPVATAQAQFEKLGMTRTRHRNGVLIFVAPKARKFAVIGDTAIHQKCGDPFWQTLAAEMTAHFKKGDFTNGITHTIHEAGKLLAAHFPHTPDDVDELPNTVAHD